MIEQKYVVVVAGTPKETAHTLSGAVVYFRV